jgi:predicted enzyme related to lactoylglutathione lyase
MHANHVAHFAIHADDVGRARAFYENVFGWRFEEWGAPDFYLIQTGVGEDRGLRGSLQKRMEPINGNGMIGCECSISVADVRATGEAIEKQGGQVRVKEMEIPTVGRLIKFSDTEGNLACAIQYNEGIQ